MRPRFQSLAIAFLGLFGANTARLSADTPRFAGVYCTDFGLMILEQDERRVSGHYGHGNRIEGQVRESDGRLDFRYEEDADRGSGWFELDEQGRSLKGQWRSAGSGGGGSWSGWLLAPRPAGGGFEGVWDTTYGLMRLRARGDAVVGSYAGCGGSSLEGEVESGRLSFRYQELLASGEGWFELRDDGALLEGRWRPEGSEEWQPWTGTRITPRGDRIYLVVLEVPWEESLAQKEYAFGEMLRSFLARYEGIEVRHRVVNDRPDLMRVMEELRYLAEPIALLLAGHGEAGCLIANEDRISMAEIGGALASVPSVFLCHFSACDVLRGDADALLGSLSEGRGLALSGYGVSVDWTASALLEMLYLDLVLGRGETPEAAASHVRKQLGFSGESGGGPLGGADFRFLQRRPDGSVEQR